MKYKVEAVVTYSINDTIIVEAVNIDEAIEKAQAEMATGLRHTGILDGTIEVDVDSTRLTDE